jgi:LEA14-like dessication related protein
MKDSSNFRMILISSLRYLTVSALIFTTCILILHRVRSDVPFVEIDTKWGERSDDSRESLLILLHIYATYATIMFYATQ